MNTIKAVIFLLLLGCLIGCGRIDNSSSWYDNSLDNTSTALSQANENLTEVATPIIIKNLERGLKEYAPQVRIIAPQAEAIVEQSELTIEIEITGLPIFRDDQLGLGNHLNLIIDNEPLQEIYNVDEPIVLKNLAPGTHSLRLFAVRPWGESYKNEGAYAQTTFSVLTTTNDNRPLSNIPLLTYNSPTGIIGAEPLLLDYYLTNLSQHRQLENNQEQEDFVVRATVNGISFLLEDWQPRYIKGLKLGENWIQLELLDRAGNKIVNSFNDTVRIITYNPEQQNTLAQLLMGKISLAEAQGILEPRYKIQPVEESEIIEPNKQVEPETTINNTTDKSVTEIELTSEDIDITATNKPEENTPVESVVSPEESNLSSMTNSDTEHVQTEKLEQPVIAPVPETQTIDEVLETIEDSSVAELSRVNLEDTEEKTKTLESTESKEINTMIQDNLDSSQPIAEIKTLQPESEIITEDEISITISETETIKTSEQETTAQVWWQKILVSLRQKIESLVRLLPKNA